MEKTFDDTYFVISFKKIIIIKKELASLEYTKKFKVFFNSLNFIFTIL